MMAKAQRRSQWHCREAVAQRGARAVEIEEGERHDGECALGVGRLDCLMFKTFNIYCASGSGPAREPEENAEL